MPLLGAHKSIAGGYHRALEAASALGMETCQLFTKNNNQWRAKPITEDEVQTFRRVLRQTKIKRPTAHNCYLINIASPVNALYRQSIDALLIEMQRAEALGLDYLVTHPGAYVCSDEENGLRHAAAAIDEIHSACKGFRARLLLETTAGQGTCLGHRFEHFARILDLVRDPDRLGFCLDTCHIFAAGYPLATEREYQTTMRSFNQLVGLNRIHVFHLNDSQKPLGSRVDRHAHIGRGQLGIEPFRFLLNDPRFRRRPMILETPKGMENGKDLDAINLEVLRGLVDHR